MPYAVRKTVVAEGQEPDAFWEALGGKGEYQSESTGAAEPQQQQQQQQHQPQLLLFNDAAAGDVEDLPDYSQADLDDDEIFLLDAFYVVLPHSCF